MLNTVKRWSRKSVFLKNLPVIALVVFGGLALETLSVAGIFRINTGVVTISQVTFALAFVEAAISIACELLALTGSIKATEFAADPRPSQRARAVKARILAYVLLIVPVFYLGNSFAFQKAMNEYTEYSGSKQEAADIANSTNTMLGEDAMAEARQNLKKGVEPKHAPFDLASFIWAAFLHTSLMIAAGTFWKPRDETPAEAKARMMEVRIAKAKATREAKKLLEAKIAAAATAKPKGKILAFGR